MPRRGSNPRDSPADGRPEPIADAFATPASAQAYNERISPSNERAALGAILDGCNAALDAYPQSEAEDAALMENGRLFAQLSRNERMAVKLRRNEKRILLRTIRVCEQALQQESQMGVLN